MVGQSSPLDPAITFKLARSPQYSLARSLLLMLTPVEFAMRKFLLLMSIGSCSCAPLSCAPLSRVDEPDPLSSSPGPRAPDRSSAKSEVQPAAARSNNVDLERSSISEKKLPLSELPAWGGLRVSLAGTPLEQAKQAVIFLHGYGTNPRDLERAQPLVMMLEDTAFILPEGPYSVGNDKHSWFEFDGTGFEKSAAQVRQLIAEFESRHPHTPYVLGGVSQGAIMSVNLLAGASEKLEALVLFSPNNSILYQPKARDRRVPIFLSHGRSDPVIPFGQTEELRTKLESWEYPVTWVPFNGGHTAPKAVVLAATQFIKRSMSSSREASTLTHTNHKPLSNSQN